MTVRVTILRASGTNCERELVHAFERCGATVELTSLRSALASRDPFGRASIVGFPGGFTYGDDVAAGKIFAMEMAAGLSDRLRDFLARGGLALGVCNGFQILAKAGILPGLTRGKQEASLAANDSGRFEERWVALEAVACRASFVPAGDVIEMPTAHGEGKFVAGDEATLRRIVDEKLVAFRYVRRDGSPATAYPDNPNGSSLAIAGICDPTGRVLGLMPHPERNVEFHHHPEWTRRATRDDGGGLRLFRNLVEQAKRGE